MSEPKKIVIKINRVPASQKATSSRSAPDQITEWNIKRIVAVLMVALLFIVVPYYYLDNGLEDSVEEDSAEVHYESSDEALNVERKQREAIVKKEVLETTVAEKFDKPADISHGDTAEPLTKPSVKPVQISKEKPVERKIEQSIVHYKVIRALLARGIANKEPVGEIKTSVKVNNDKATGVFYFTEIKDMKGRVFYHQWVREGRLVYKRRINVLGNRWRVSTSKLFRPSSVGNWTVRLIDKQGKIYNEINFKVIAE